MQHTHARDRRRGPFRRAVAAGQRLNLAIFLGCVVVGYVAWILLTPRITAYQLEGAITPVCRTYMGWLFAGQVTKTVDRSFDWQRDWERRTRSLGIPLREDQYDFRTSPGCDKKKGCVCTGEAVFELTTPWFLLEDFFDIPPYKSTHHVIKNVEWRTSY